MRPFRESVRMVVEHILPILILVVLMFYTYVRFAEHPYLGFRLNSAGRIIQIFVDDTKAEPLLKLNDQLVEINGLRWEDFRTKLRQPLYSDGQPGDVLKLGIQRGTQPQINIDWVLPSQNGWEIFHLVFTQVWLAYIFWFAGLLTLFNMRPKDERWWLMMAFNYVTAIWIIAGGDVSFYHLQEGAIVLRMAIWFSIPIYLQMNWFFPKPLSKLPKWLIWGSYVLAAALALAEWFEKMPTSLYYLGFLGAIVGSFMLLLIHAKFQPEVRRDLRLLAVFSFLLPSVFGLMYLLGAGPLFYGGAAILSLPLFPFGYLYASYRRLLGDLEMRVNRLISAWIFLIMLGAILFPFITWTGTWISWDESALFTSITITFLATVTAIYFFTPFQTFVEKRLMGIRLAPVQLQETYASRITTSASSENLRTLIQDEILPSLLVRQFVFLQFNDEDAPNVFLSIGVTEGQYPLKANIPKLIASAEKYRPLSVLTDDEPCRWVRLVLVLKIEGKLIGLWLFGKRDPDDLYPQMDIPKLQSLADQTAIAQSNLFHAERLKALHLANINRHEAERLNLALELHDGVLNQIAALKVSLNTPLPDDFEENYQKLTVQVREIITTLRPPMLSYGLIPALSGLVDILSDHSQDKIQIILNIDADDVRYDPNIEQHLFRIIQEACENSIRHANAKKIVITGQCLPTQIDVVVSDDGVGFQNSDGFSLEGLIGKKHFGLAGMMERAKLIGAEFNIKSTPEQGTQVRMMWVQPNRGTS